MPLTISVSKNRGACLLQSELTVMGDSSLLQSAPLYCQPIELTVPELLSQRLDRPSANCRSQFLCF